MSLEITLKKTRFTIKNILLTHTAFLTAFKAAQTVFKLNKYCIHIFTMRSMQDGLQVIFFHNSKLM